ncbi:MAG: PLP-dependent aspartate aminotransferase family protein [Desulfobacterales bacterium]|nr:PLP-dependent aspartate aminotransferase family protein [Desulfobacterales bacterium]
MQKSTRCVHSGTAKDPLTRGLNTPIFTSSSFEYLDTDHNVYPRYFNIPNQKAVVDKLCALENAEDGLLFSSGMAAISTAMLAFLGSGDHVVLQKDIYGGTHHFVTADFKRFGIEFTFVSNEADDIEKAVTANTKIIYIETPSNPLLLVTDIASTAQIAKHHNALSIIDNTFATPINQNPLDLGIDIVAHSGTKYLGGHSDLCCGAVVTRRELADKIAATAANLGGSMNAMTCYLLERSLKTLGVRVDKHNRNAQIIAEHLQKDARIQKVFYPGLEDHPGHVLAKKQMRGFGGMLAFELGGQSPEHFLKNLKVITPALSLGGVETIICSPATTSHQKISAAERAELGITDNTLRLSVGIEDPDDIIADIDRALSG